MREVKEGCQKGERGERERGVREVKEGCERGERGVSEG